MEDDAEYSLEDLIKAERYLNTLKFKNQLCEKCKELFSKCSDDPDYSITSHGLDSTLLNWARSCNEEDCLKLLIEKRANVNCRTEQKHVTPLMFVANKGNKENLQVLIKAGADVNRQTKQGTTALLFAVDKGYIGCVRVLIQSGANVNTRNDKGFTALIQAANNGDAKCLNLLIEARANVNARTNEAHKTALTVATENRHTECVNILLKVGAVVNFSTKDGKTPVMLASLCGHIECLQLLIEAEADVNRRTQNNNTALGYATEKGYGECVKLLIKAGADVDMEASDGYTPVHIAAIEGQDECIRLLIEAEADVNISTKDGHTSLMLSAGNGYSQCTKLLIEAGADVNKTDTKSGTALTYSATMARDSISETLIKAGAHVNVINYTGSTPLMLAARKMPENLSMQVLNCTRLFLRAGAHVNILDVYGRNALQDRIFTAGNHSPHQDICMLLYAAGETIDGTTVDGMRENSAFEHVPVPDYLLHKNLKLDLRHLCREAIRKHLLVLDPHQHLFYRVPRLGLPSSLSRYLLFDIELGDPFEVIPPKVLRRKVCPVTRRDAKSVTKSPDVTPTEINLHTSTAANASPAVSNDQVVIVTTTDADCNRQGDRKLGEKCCCTII